MVYASRDVLRRCDKTNRKVRCVCDHGAVQLKLLVDRRDILDSFVAWCVFGSDLDDKRNEGDNRPL